MKVKDYLKFIETIKEFEMNEKASLFDDDPDYLIIDAKVKNSYVVTSWTHGKAPKNVYTVSKAGKKWLCNCPTRTSYCKHIDMVKQWLKDGKPSEWQVDMKELKKILNSKGVGV